MTTDARDARDLAVLAMREDGHPARLIARVLRLSVDVVETILQLDADEFPDEPLRGRT